MADETLLTTKLDNSAILNNAYNDLWSAATSASSIVLVDGKILPSGYNKTQVEDFFATNGYDPETTLFDDVLGKNIVEASIAKQNGYENIPEPKLAGVTVTFAGAIENSPPKVINTGDAPVLGGPTNTPQSATGDIKNTNIAATNNTVSHACDTTIYIRQKVNLAQMAKPIIDTIRKAIAAILEFFGVTPGPSAFVDNIKALAKKVKDAIKFLKKVQATVGEYIKVITEIKAVIEYILSLPAELLKHFMKCLAEAYAELKNQFLQVVKQASDAGSTNAFDDVLKASKDLIQSTGDLIKEATVTVGVIAVSPIAAIAQPTTAEEKAKAKATVDGAFLDFTGPPKVYEKA
jgi:ElaB/YqjD/DUF883 family membrane-anchored ribosome-binding protein